MAEKSAKAIRWEKREKRRKIISRISFCLLMILCIFSYTPFGRSFWKGAFRASGFSGGPTATFRVPLCIHMVDVGKADAFLLECEGQTALLDGGNYEDGETLVNYLHRRGISSLDYLIMSHPDKDHIGGMLNILKEVPVKNFIQTEASRNEKSKSALYQEILGLVESSIAVEKTVSSGDTIPLGSAVLTVLGPLKEYEDTNNSSLVFKLTYQELSALFCGDIEREAEDDLVRSGIDLSADILKVSHHGSGNSSTERFLREVSPQYAAISVAPDRSALPKEETLLRLEDVGAKIFQTDVDGTVWFYYDSEGLHVETEK